MLDHDIRHSSSHERYLYTCHTIPTFQHVYRFQMVMKEMPVCSHHDRRSSGFLPNADIGVCTPVSVYCDIYTDIGADFNDTRYRCTPISAFTRYRVYPISGIPDIGFTPYRVNADIGENRYRHNITIYRYRRLPISGIPDIGYTRYRVYTDIGIISYYTDIGVHPT
jgi:hypothetical protein